MLVREVATPIEQLGQIVLDYLQQQQQQQQQQPQVYQIPFFFSQQSFILPSLTHSSSFGT